MTQTPADRKQDRQASAWSEFRLRRHSDFQRVYAGSRKRFSDSMTYFFARRPEPVDGSPARVGLTAGRVLGKAVERNRIKRRMREAVRKHVGQLPPEVDVVLHPRKSVMTMDFAALEREVGAVFARIAEQLAKNSAGTARPVAGQSGRKPEKRHASGPAANAKPQSSLDEPDGRVRP